MCHAQAFSMECLSLKQNVKGKVFSIDCFPLILTHIEAIRSVNRNCLEFPLSTHKLTDENKTSKSFELKLYNYLQLTFPVNKVGKVSLGFFLFIACAFACVCDRSVFSCAVASVQLRELRRKEVKKAFIFFGDKL